MGQAPETKDFIDEHLFVESLAICALQIEGYSPDLSDVEWCIRFVEKMVNSTKDRPPSINNIDFINSMMNKKEIIIPFWEHYHWYFEEWYLKAVNDEMKQGNNRMSFSDVFDQSSLAGYFDYYQNFDV